jgi:hypothetical protein
MEKEFFLNFGRNIKKRACFILVAFCTLATIKTTSYLPGVILLIAAVFNSRWPEIFTASTVSLVLLAGVLLAAPYLYKAAYLSGNSLNRVSFNISQCQYYNNNICWIKSTKK